MKSQQTDVYGHRSPSGTIHPEYGPVLLRFGRSGLHLVRAVQRSRSSLTYLEEGGVGDSNGGCWSSCSQRPSSLSKLGSLHNRGTSGSADAHHQPLTTTTTTDSSLPPSLSLPRTYIQFSDVAKTRYPWILTPTSPIRTLTDNKATTTQTRTTRVIMRRHHLIRFLGPHPPSQHLFWRMLTNTMLAS